jgi:hypothetical protein
MTKPIALLLGLLVACGSDDAPITPDADDPTPDAPDVAPRFVQVEHLARPGINEALLISDAFLAGYNATAPSFAGVPQVTLDQVVAEAKTVLRALYLGTCLLNGVAGLTPQTGLKPAGLECHAVGGAVFEADGETQTAASIAASQAYADAVFGLFIPDVMRVDTSVPSNYETLCGTGPVGLCGGRFVNDDVIDTTYDFLLNGAQTPKKGAPNQFNALTSDGVVFDPENEANNVNNRHLGDAKNRQQGHPRVANAFPYSAPPL